MKRLKYKLIKLANDLTFEYIQKNRRTNENIKYCYPDFSIYISSDLGIIRIFTTDGLVVTCPLYYKNEKNNYSISDIRKVIDILNKVKSLYIKG